MRVRTTKAKKKEITGKTGARRGARTHDIEIKSLTLYRLS
jgi:hypothetical protein